MAQVYDSEKIRAVARMIDKLSNQMDAEVTDGLRSTAQETEVLQGRAARALEERADELKREIRNIDSELEELASRLRRFAANLEAADERMANAMK